MSSNSMKDRRLSCVCVCAHARTRVHACVHVCVCNIIYTVWSGKQTKTAWTIASKSTLTLEQELNNQNHDHGNNSPNYRKFNILFYF